MRLDAHSAAVHVAGGEPAVAVAEAAEALRDALARATGDPMQVTVHPRSFNRRASMPGPPGKRPRRAAALRYDQRQELRARGRWPPARV